MMVLIIKYIHGPKTCEQQGSTCTDSAGEALLNNLDSDDMGIIVVSV